MPLGPTLLILFTWSQVKKLIGINPMVLSDPWADSLDIISLRPVKKWLGVNPMILSVPWVDSLDIISVQKAKIN